MQGGWGRNKHLVKRWIDVPVMWDLHCSFITHDLCWANSNQLLNYEPTRSCLHYGGGFPNWLGECLIAARPGTEVWSLHTHTQPVSVCAYSALPDCAWICKYTTYAKLIQRCMHAHTRTHTLLPGKAFSSVPSLCWNLQPDAELTLTSVDNEL